MNPILCSLNNVLADPSHESIFALFEEEGFIRFNMLYVSPLALKHFKEKLDQYGLKSWAFTEKELVFQLPSFTVRFVGSLSITQSEKIFSLELDFDPLVPNDGAMDFLKDIETFLKKCDSCFFMTYNICIDSEILNYPLCKSIEYLLNRK